MTCRSGRSPAACGSAPWRSRKRLSILSGARAKLAVARGVNPFVWGTRSVPSHPLRRLDDATLQIGPGPGRCGAARQPGPGAAARPRPRWFRRRPEHCPAGTKRQRQARSEDQRRRGHENQGCPRQGERRPQGRCRQAARPQCHSGRARRCAQEGERGQREGAEGLPQGRPAGTPEPDPLLRHGLRRLRGQDGSGKAEAHRQAEGRPQGNDHRLPEGHAGPASCPGHQAERRRHPGGHEEAPGHQQGLHGQGNQDP